MKQRDSHGFLEGGCVKGRAPVLPSVGLVLDCCSFYCIHFVEKLCWDLLWLITGLVTRTFRDFTVMCSLQYLAITEFFCFRKLARSGCVEIHFSLYCNESRCKKSDSRWCTAQPDVLDTLLHGHVSVGRSLSVLAVDAWTVTTLQSSKLMVLLEIYIMPIPEKASWD